jgi:hypothetical protein
MTELKMRVLMKRVLENILDGLGVLAESIIEAEGIITA